MAIVQPSLFRSILQQRITMYWIYNVLLIFYWIGLIPVILYRLAFEDGFYERIKQSAGYMPASLLKKIEDVVLFGFMLLL